MKIIILNGNSEASNVGFEQYINNYVKALSAKGNEVQVFTLRDMDIKFCSGCWSCWWTTPGRCVFKDDAEKIYRATVHSDILVFASPLVMGFVSTLTKKISDRLIPLIMPYIKIVKEEMRHTRRYKRLPAIGLLLEKGDSDNEDIEITADIYKRLSLNFRVPFRFCKLTDVPVQEVVNETLNI